MRSWPGRLRRSSGRRRAWLGRKMRRRDAQCPHVLAPSGAADTRHGLHEKDVCPQTAKATPTMAATPEKIRPRKPQPSPPRSRSYIRKPEASSNGATQYRNFSKYSESPGYSPVADSITDRARSTSPCSSSGRTLPRSTAKRRWTK